MNNTEHSGNKPPEYHQGLLALGTDVHKNRARAAACVRSDSISVVGKYHICCRQCYDTESDSRYISVAARNYSAAVCPLEDHQTSVNVGLCLIRS